MPEDRATAQQDANPEGGARKGRKKRSPLGVLAVVVVIALVCGGLYLGVSKGVSWLGDQFGAPDDYSGPGTGEVLVEVESGDTAAAIGRTLKDAGVVASVQAFIDVAAADSRSSAIQVGYYSLRSEMAAADALEHLVEPGNLVKATVTVPEGLQVVEIVDILAEKTEFSAAAYRKALKDPGALGLPDYAEGNAEGYLFPATYEIGPKDEPTDILAKMVDRWRKAADDANLEERAAAMGKTPAEVMIIASLVEAEGRGDDMPKIARVIYNRLDGPGDKGGTNGTLGIDASNAYGIGKSGTTQLTPDELAVDTPYNTRKYAGLPPTPIEAPGDDAIDAAANPVDGPWYYYVTVNLETGETKFSETYDEFLVYKAELNAYCAERSC